MPPAITDETILTARAGAVSAELEGEIVLLDTHSGQYFGMNAVGASIWRRLQTPQTMAQVCAALLEEYETDPQTCESDLRDFVHDCLAQGLLEVCPDAGS